MQDDEAMDKWHSTRAPFGQSTFRGDSARDEIERQRQAPLYNTMKEQLAFQIGQAAYWKKKYEQARDALEANDPPPNTINVAMCDLPMEYLLYQERTGEWRIGDMCDYAHHDGHKRAVITLESK